MMPKCFHVDIFYFESLKQKIACYLSLCVFIFRRLLSSPRGLNFIDIYTQGEHKKLDYF